MLLHRTNFPKSIETRPWHIRANRLPELLEQLQLLLFAEHHLASGGAVELEHEFGLLTPKLVLDLPGHPIEPSSNLLLVSAREPDARALGDLSLHGDRSVGHLYFGYASNDVLFVLHVAGSPETERKRYGVRQPVLILGESLLWQILPEYFCGGFTVYLVDDVSLGARHLPLATYWDQAVAHGPTSLCLTREQSVGDTIGDDLVVAVLIGWRPRIEVVACSPAPQWEESVAWKTLLQPCKEVIEVRLKEAIDRHRDSIREDKQANGVSGQVG